MYAFYFNGLIFVAKYLLSTLMESEAQRSAIPSKQTNASPETLEFASKSFDCQQQRQHPM